MSVNRHLSRESRGEICLISLGKPEEASCQVIADFRCGVVAMVVVVMAMVVATMVVVVAMMVVVVAMMVVVVAMMVVSGGGGSSGGGGGNDGW